MEKKRREKERKKEREKKSRNRETVHVHVCTYDKWKVCVMTTGREKNEKGGGGGEERRRKKQFFLKVIKFYIRYLVGEGHFPTRRMIIKVWAVEKGIGKMRAAWTYRIKTYKNNHISKPPKHTHTPSSVARGVRLHEEESPGIQQKEVEERNWEEARQSQVLPSHTVHHGGDWARKRRTEQWIITQDRRKRVPLANRDTPA